MLTVLYIIGGSAISIAMIWACFTIEPPEEG